MNSLKTTETISMFSLLICAFSLSISQQLSQSKILRIQPIPTVLLIFITMLFTSNLLAGNDKYLLAKENWKHLSEINTLLKNGQNTNAINKLNSLLPTIKNITYDTAIAQQTLGYAYQANRDYPQAISSFKKALNTNVLPPSINHDLQYNIAQLLIHTQKYKEGLTYFERWVSAEKKPDLKACILAGNAYYQAGLYKKAIPYAEKVIQSQTKYDDNWYQLLTSSYIYSAQYQNAAHLLERMIRHKPENKTYWQQLLITWQHANNDQKTLATMELMQARDLFNNEESKQLITMYLYMNMPYKSAKLLQSEMAHGRIAKDKKNWSQLGNSWLQAKERLKAVHALKQAAKLSDDANLYFLIGHIYFDLEDYPKATTHLESALQKGNLSHLAQAHLLLGIAAFHQKNYSQSRAALTAAMNHKKTHNQAQWWLERIDDLDKVNS